MIAASVQTKVYLPSISAEAHQRCLVDHVQSSLSYPKGCRASDRIGSSFVMVHCEMGGSIASPKAPLSFPEQADTMSRGVRFHLPAILVTGALGGLMAASGRLSQQDQSNPLPSWNDGPAKKAILEFVRVTTDKASPKYVPPEQRIATFDQDGTLWVEHPMYTQVIYCLERVPAVVKQKPELKDREPFKTVLSGDREAIAKLLDEGTGGDSGRDAFRHVRGRIPSRGQEVAGHRQAPALEASLHGTHLSADARSFEVLPRQRLQDLHRDRRRTRFRPRLRRASLRHSARASRRHRGRNEVRLRQGRHGRFSPKNPSCCSTTTMPASPRASIS